MFPTPGNKYIFSLIQFYRGCIFYLVVWTDGWSGRIRLECNYCGPISIMRREAAREQNVVGYSFCCILIIYTTHRADKAFLCYFNFTLRKFKHVSMM